ncbi:MAG TPA: isochorismatase family cysteine hydrolase [Chthoniobacterales bacterium]|jgi:nicotinamidase-related amidase
MSTTPRDTHGSAPEHSETVLLLIDVINDFDFPEGKDLLRYALPAAKKIGALKERLGEKIPTIYVNDNFGRWKSDFKAIIEHCLDDHNPGAEVARLLLPSEKDYFVLKPKHSAFFSTSLDVLLHYLGAKNLIITGFAGDFCVLFTANDAYMRDYKIVVPPDCIASETTKANTEALAQMKRFLKADIRESEQIEV